MQPKLTHSIMDLIGPGSGLHRGEGTIFYTLDQVSVLPVVSYFFPQRRPNFILHTALREKC